MPLPESSEQWREAACEFWLRGDLGEALKAQERALQLAPEDELNQSVMAVLLLASGDAGTALLYAGRALAAKPEDPVNLGVYGRALLDTGDAALAVAYLEQASVDGQPDTLASLSLARARMSDWNGAWKAMEEALAQNASPAAWYVLAGDILVHLGDRSRARGYFATANMLDASIEVRPQGGNLV